MTFLAPWFLIATLAAAVPVILHMINRQRAKELPFSTLRFLRISVQKTKRRRRIHDLLLMLIRAAVLVLIAVGLADMRLTSLKTLLGGGSAAAVVMVLDNSASMGVADAPDSAESGGEAEQMRFDLAKKAAHQILAQVPEGDQIALLLTGGPPFPEAGKFHRTHDAIEDILDQSAVSYERADLGLRIQEARKLLAESEASNKLIYVLTDQQRHSWDSFKKEEESAEEPLSAEEKKAREAPVVVVDCNRQPRPNQSIDDVQIEAAMPVAGLPIKVSAKVYNAAPVEQQRLIKLFVDDTEEGTSAALNIPPQQSVTYPFTFVFKRGGLHRGEVRLVDPAPQQPDGSTFDDRRFFSMEVDQAIPVAVVRAEDKADHSDDGFYLANALSPKREGTWAIRVKKLLPKDLVDEPLSEYAMIFLVNLPAPSGDAAAKLRAYVESGRHLMWVSGENVQPAAYNQMNDAAQGTLLPAPLVDVRLASHEPDRDSWNIASLDKEHPALRNLVTPPSLYQTVLVYKHVRIDTKDTGAEVLAHLDDGAPLLVQKRMGRGTVLFLGTSAQRDWTNLPLKPIFLPMMVQMAFHLGGAQQVYRNSIAGSPLVHEFDQEAAPIKVQMTLPSGVQKQLETTGVPGKLGQTLRFGEAFDIGVYVLEPLEGIGRAPVSFAVNVDPDEASPVKIDRDELKERFGETSVLFADNPEDLSKTFEELRYGKKLWTLLLAAVLIGLVFEVFVSNRLSPKSPDEEVHKIPLGMRPKQRHVAAL